MNWEFRLGSELGHPAWVGAVVAGLALASFVAVRRLSGTPLTPDDPAAPLPLEPSAISGIERIDGSLRAARAEALEGGGRPGRLADLLAYRSYLEGIRESALAPPRCCASPPTC